MTHDYKRNSTTTLFGVVGCGATGVASICDEAVHDG